MQYKVKLLGGLFFLLSFMAQGQNLLQDITFPQIYYPFEIDFSQNCNDKFRHNWQNNSQVNFGWKAVKWDSFQTYYFQFNAKKKASNVLQLTIDKQGIKPKDSLVLNFGIESFKTSKKTIVKLAFIDNPIDMDRLEMLSPIKPFYQVEFLYTFNQSEIKLPLIASSIKRTLVIWVEGAENDTALVTVSNLSVIKKGSSARPTDAEFDSVKLKPLNIDYISMNLNLNESTLDTSKNRFFNSLGDIDYKRIILNVHIDTFTFSATQIDILKKIASYYSALLAKMYPNVPIEVLHVVYEKAGKDDEYKTKDMGRIEFAFVKDF